MQNRAAALVLTVLPLLAAPVDAQDRPAPLPATPRIELFAGYEEHTTGNGHVRFGVDWNVNDRVALVFNAPAFGVASSPTTGTSVFYTFLAGPRLRFRQQQRVMPFVQALFGVARGSAISSTFGTRDRPTAFQAAFGAGVDLALSRRFAWRVLQVEERSRFGRQDGDHRLSLSSGIVVRFGARK